MPGMWLQFLGFLRAERAAVSVVSAVGGIVLIGFTGLATDVGAVYLHARRLQGAVDIAALAAADQPGNGRPAAVNTIRANGFSDVTNVRAESGRYTPDRDIRPAERFVVNAPDTNAVRVEASSRAPLYFSRLFVPDGHMRVTRRATAAQARLASFEIGSRLLSLRGGIANNMLSALTGSSVNLSVMDYNALASADIDLLTYVDALRTRIDLEAGTFDEALNGRVDTPDAIDAIADVIDDRQAANAMRRIASATRGESTNINRLIDLGPYGDQDVTLHSESRRINVNAMDLATAILELANGDRQVRFDAGANVPGVASAAIWLAIGERPNNSPWLSVTEDYDVIIRTAQMRLFVEANVRAAAPLLSIRVPVLIEAASAQARLADISCAGASRGVTLSVAPSIGSIHLGDVDTRRLDDFRTPLRPTRATLFQLALARVAGEAHVDVGGHQWTNVRFSGADIDNGVVKTVSTRDAARATLSSLLGETHLTVRDGGLGLGAPVLTSVTRSALTAAGAPLDNLVNGLTDLLGVHLGEADVRVNGVRCGGAVLVG